MHWWRGSGMGLSLHHRLCILLCDPAMWGNVVTLYTCKRAGRIGTTGQSINRWWRTYVRRGVTPTFWSVWGLLRTICASELRGNSGVYLGHRRIAVGADHNPTGSVSSSCTMSIDDSRIWDRFVRNAMAVWHLAHLSNFLTL